MDPPPPLPSLDDTAAAAADDFKTILHCESLTLRLQ